jgi:hypothetical protein
VSKAAAEGKVKTFTANADSSIPGNCEFDSNVTDGSDLQQEKQKSCKISILNSFTTEFDLPK